MIPQTDVPVQAGVIAMPAQGPSTGYMSSEFITTLGAVAGLAYGVIPPQYSGLVAAIVGVYTACRTLLKVVHTLGYGSSIPDLPALPAGTTVTNITQVPK